MIIPYTKLVGVSVFELKTQTKVGYVLDLIIKKSDISIYGLVVKTSMLPFAKMKVIAETDIVEVGNDGVIIQENDSISDFDDAVRLKEAYHHKLHGIHQHVRSKSGKNLGKVFDYLVRATDLSITKIYVKSLVSERIIPTSAITDIKGKQITVNNDYDLVDVKTSAIEAEMV